MAPLRSLRRSAPALAFLLAASSLPARPSAEAEVWGDVVVNHLDLANAVFADEDSGLDPRARAFGEAVTLLNLQPRTEARIARATALLDELAGGAEDELTAPARYFRARIDQMHLQTPDLASALRRYDALFVDSPEHPLAQLGAVKAAMIRIYTAEDPLGEAFARAEALAPRMRDRVARSSLHLMLATVCTRFGDEAERSLGHLRAAAAAGIHNAKIRGNTFVRIGVLAEELGQGDVAREAYRRFLAEFERDDRAHTLRERLRALEGGKA